MEERRPSDAELLRRAADDPEAFGQLYDRHVTQLLAYFQRRTADPQMAADLAAETFAQAFAKRRTFRDTGASAAAWLQTIARNELFQSLRRGRVADRYRRRLGMEPILLDDDSYERIEA